MLIERNKLIKELIRQVKLRESVHVSAKPGFGATSLLKELEGKRAGVYYEAGSLKPLLQALSGNDKGTISELRECINPKERVLLLDDVQLITKQVKRIIEKFIRQGLTVLSAGSRNVFGFQQLELKALSFKSSVTLVNSFLHNKELSKVIALEIGGNPSLLMNAVRKALARKDLLTLNGFNEFRHSINFSIPRRELIPNAWVFPLAAVFFAFKYVFYGSGDFNEGYIMALIAFSLTALGRFNRASKSL